MHHTFLLVCKVCNPCWARALNACQACLIRRHKVSIIIKQASLLLSHDVATGVSDDDAMPFLQADYEVVQGLLTCSDVAA